MRPEERGRSWSTRTQPWGGGTDGLGDRGTGQLPQDREGMGVWEAAALKRLKQARDPHLEASCRTPCVPAWASLPGPASCSPASTWTTPKRQPEEGRCHHRCSIVHQHVQCKGIPGPCPHGADPLEGHKKQWQSGQTTPMRLCDVGREAEWAWAPAHTPGVQMEPVLGVQGMGGECLKTGQGRPSGHLHQGTKCE